MESSSRNAFESVKAEIGYCGIWCGSRAVGNGALGEITTRYEKMLAAYGLKQWAPSLWLLIKGAKVQPLAASTS
jgi:hypothetical protein